MAVETGVVIENIDELAASGSWEIPERWALRELVQSFYDYQELRKGTANRQRAGVQDGYLNAQEAAYYFSGALTHLTTMEAECERLIKAEIKEDPIWQGFFRHIKGVGEILAGGLLSTVDIEKADTVSALWRYTGMGVTDGRADRRERGKKLHYNPFDKTLCWKLAASFLRCGSPYARIYYTAKAGYESRALANGGCAFPDQREECLAKMAKSKKPPACKGHVDAGARRVMVKRFLSHLWDFWRRARGLSTRGPWVEEYGGHEHIDSWEDYVEARGVEEPKELQRAIIA